MKITRNILDNGKKIIHVQYSKNDIKKQKNIAAKKLNKNTQK